MRKIKIIFWESRFGKFLYRHLVYKPFGSETEKIRWGLLGKFTLGLFVFIAVSTISFVYFSQPKEKEVEPILTPQSNIPVATNTITPVPTPFLFQELTIPHLKSRDFDSQLNTLDKLSENGNYTSYLTSFNSDGLRINGLLTIPKGEKPSEGWPAVVFVHGYIPPTSYRTVQNYSSYVDYLADRGIVVFKIDLRGHDKSEGEAFGAYYSEGYVVDILNAYRALQIAEFVDPSNIGLWGHSMAGNVVFRSLVVMPKIPKVVIVAGAVYTYKDFSDYRISDNSYQPPPQESERRRRRAELFDTYGEFNEDSEFWRQVVPTNYLDDLDGEVQIHHATNDNVVKIGYSRNLVTVLDKDGVKNELFEYQSGGHNLTGSSFNQAMQRTVEFFKR